jgi:hypothetical protein
MVQRLEEHGTVLILADANCTTDSQSPLSEQQCRSGFIHNSPQAVLGATWHFRRSRTAEKDIHFCMIGVTHDTLCIAEEYWKPPACSCGARHLIKNYGWVILGMYELG